jgi:hypothetical protein
MLNRDTIDFGDIVHGTEAVELLEVVNPGTFCLTYKWYIKPGSTEIEHDLPEDEEGNEEENDEEEDEEEEEEVVEEEEEEENEQYVIEDEEEEENDNEFEDNEDEVF